MTDFVWDGDIAGVINDSSGANGSSNGFGTITTSGNTSLTDGDSITVQNCDTILTGAANAWVVSGDSLLTFNATAARPLLFESAAAVPAPGDWSFLISQGADGVGLGPKVRAFHTTFQNGGGFDVLGGGDDLGWAELSLYNCILQNMDAALISFGKSGNEVGDSGQLTVHQCQVIGVANDVDGLRNCIRIHGRSGAAVIGDIRRSTIFFRALATGGQLLTLRAVEGTMTLANNIIAVENTDGAQVSRIASAGTNGVFTTLGGNFVHTYVEAQDLGALTLKATTPIDQAVDPAFFDDTPGAPFPGVDLRPDGGAGSPDLWNADTDGVWHSGALEPHNLSTYVTTAGAGTAALYGEKKQRVYENSFGLSPTRGRGIKMKLRAEDTKSRKLYAGIWVRFAAEEPR